MTNPDLNRPQKISKPIQMDDLDDLLDDVAFRPITDGLGFHHNQTSSKATEAVSRVQMPAPARTMKPMAQTPTAHEVVKSDLQLFYHHQGTPLDVVQPERVLEEEIKADKKASWGPRILAYAVDLSVLLIIVMASAKILSIATSISFADLVWEGNVEIVSTLIVLFCFFYVLYFSVSEKVQGRTFGKELVGIRVKSIYRVPLTLDVLMLRSLISLLSFISLGVCALVDLHGKLTSTHVVK